MKCFAAILLVALFFGRPTHGQHENKIANKVSEIFDIEKGSIFELGKSFVGNEYLELNDYYMFTTCSIKGQVVSIGFLRYVYVFDDVLTFKLLQ